MTAGSRRFPSTAAGERLLKAPESRLSREERIAILLVGAVLRGAVDAVFWPARAPRAAAVYLGLWCAFMLAWFGSAPNVVTIALILFWFLLFYVWLAVMLRPDITRTKQSSRAGSPVIQAMEK